MACTTPRTKALKREREEFIPWPHLSAFCRFDPVYEMLIFSTAVSCQIRVGLALRLCHIHTTPTPRTVQVPHSQRTQHLVPFGETRAYTACEEPL